MLQALWLRDPGGPSEVLHGRGGRVQEGASGGISGPGRPFCSARSVTCTRPATAVPVERGKARRVAVCEDPDESGRQKREADDHHDGPGETFASGQYNARQDEHDGSDEGRPPRLPPPTKECLFVRHFTLRNTNRLTRQKLWLDRTGPALLVALDVVRLVLVPVMVRRGLALRR